MLVSACTCYNKWTRDTTRIKLINPKNAIDLFEKSNVDDRFSDELLFRKSSCVKEMSESCGLVREELSEMSVSSDLPKEVSVISK